MREKRFYTAILNYNSTEKLIYENEQKTSSYSIPVDCRPPAIAAGAYKNKYKIRVDRKLPV
jgi:hypothetical protein